MGSGFAKKKKEAKVMQEKFHEIQEKLKNTLVTGSAGGGMVEITLNGDHEMTQVKLKPECVDPEDIEGLEDLIRVAYSDALKKVNKLSDSTMPSLPGGFGNF